MRSRPFKAILAVLFVVFIISVLVNPKAPSKPYYDGVTGTLVIAHQGGDGVWPGDTMYAFEKAVEIGADVLEMDAHITKDGRIVLMHDEKVDRTTDGTGLIEDMTLDELKQLDAAYKWSNDDGQTFPVSRTGDSSPGIG